MALTGVWVFIIHHRKCHLNNSANTMELKGNIFFNVTLSFWTSPHTSNSSTGTKPANYRLQHDANNLTKSNAHPANVSLIQTLNSTKNRNAFKENLFNFLLFKDNLSDTSEPIDRKPNGNLSSSIINTNITNLNILDTFPSSNQTKANYSLLDSVENSLHSAVHKNSFVASHYSDSALYHEPKAHLSKLINTVGDELNSNISTVGWTSWNLTLSSEPTTNWTDVFYLNNQSSVNDINCLNDNFFNDGCAFQPNHSTNSTTDYNQLFNQHEREYWALFLIILPILALFGNFLVILRYVPIIVIAY